MCTEHAAECRVQARLKVKDDVFAAWKWAIRATNSSAPRELSDADARVRDEMAAEQRGAGTDNVPIISMVHEAKGRAPRGPAAQFSLPEAQIRLK